MVLRQASDFIRAQSYVKQKLLCILIRERFILHDTYTQRSWISSMTLDDIQRIETILFDNYNFYDAERST